MEWVCVIQRFSRPWIRIRTVGGGVQTGSTRHVDHLLAYCTCPGWLWGWRIWWNEDWQGNRSTRRKTAPAPLCTPQIPFYQTRAAAVGSQRLTAWAMARPRIRRIRHVVLSRIISLSEEFTAPFFRVDLDDSGRKFLRIRIHSITRSGWCLDKALHFYWGGTRFVSRPGHRLP
jgi:hypothetical protein